MTNVNVKVSFPGIFDQLRNTWSDKCKKWPSQLSMLNRSNITDLLVYSVGFSSVILDRTNVKINRHNWACSIDHRHNWACLIYRIFQTWSYIQLDRWAASAASIKSVGHLLRTTDWFFKTYTKTKSSFEQPFVRLRALIGEATVSLHCSPQC